METTTRIRQSLPQFATYDPADSPGPIPSVIERFRPRPYDPNEEDPDGPEATARRYTIILVTPEHAEALKHDRCEAGLKLYVDDEWERRSRRPLRGRHLHREGVRLPCHAGGAPVRPHLLDRPPARHSRHGSRLTDPRASGAQRPCRASAVDGLGRSRTNRVRAAISP